MKQIRKTLVKSMNEKTVLYLSDKEEEFVSILTKVGTRKNVAKVLVFFTNTAKATQRTIERGADLRQPEVSIALKYMAGEGWVTSSEIPSPKGRPNKLFTLALPVRQIMTSIEKRTKERANSQIELARMMKSYI
jgi:predicted transcriptional regulator